jgi:hypothetical protein
METLAMTRRHSGKSLGHSSSVGLILIDARPRRHEERSRYHSRNRQLDQATSQLNNFENSELPAFKQWFERELASPLSILRKLQQQLQELQGVVFDVEHYAGITGISRAAAYRQIMTAKAAGNLDQLWADVLKSNDPDSQVDDECGEDPFATFRASSKSAEDHDEPYNEREARRPAETARPSAATAAEDYAKSLYRRLVRVLHPDMNPATGLEKLWEEVQQAYALGDIAELERLQRVILKGEARTIDLEAIPISDIIALRKVVETRLRALRKALREAKQHPAWGFSAKAKGQAKLQDLKRSLSGALAMDMQVMRAELRDLERAITHWAKAQMRPKSHAGRGRDKHRGGNSASY